MMIVFIVLAAVGCGLEAFQIRHPRVNFGWVGLALYFIGLIVGK